MWSTSPLNMFNVKYFLLDYLISFSEVFFFFCILNKVMVSTLWQTTRFYYKQHYSTQDMAEINKK